MGICGSKESPEERDQREISHQIDRSLKAAGDLTAKECKILLLGTSSPLPLVSPRSNPAPDAYLATSKALARAERARLLNK